MLTQSSIVCTNNCVLSENDFPRIFQTKPKSHACFLTFVAQKSGEKWGPSSSCLNSKGELGGRDFYPAQATTPIVVLPGPWCPGDDNTIWTLCDQITAVYSYRTIVEKNSEVAIDPNAVIRLAGPSHHCRVTLILIPLHELLTTSRPNSKLAATIKPYMVQHQVTSYTALPQLVWVPQGANWQSHFPELYGSWANCDLLSQPPFPPPHAFPGAAYGNNTFLKAMKTCLFHHAFGSS